MIKVSKSINLKANNIRRKNVKSLGYTSFKKFPNTDFNCMRNQLKKISKYAVEIEIRIIKKGNLVTKIFSFDRKFSISTLK